MVLLSSVGLNVSVVDDFRLKFVYFFHVLNKGKTRTVAYDYVVVVVAYQSALEIVLIELHKRR